MNKHKVLLRGLSAYIIVFLFASLFFVSFFRISGFMAASLSALLALVAFMIIVYKYERALYDAINRINLVLKKYLGAEAPSHGDLAASDKLQMLSLAENDIEHIFEHRLHRMEEENRNISSIFDHLTDGVVAVDGHGNILLLNKASQKFFSVSGDAAGGRALLEIAHNRQIDNMMKKALREKIRIEDEVVWGSPNELRFKVQAMGIAAQESRVKGVLVMTDITEIRRLEAMRREFVANVSHELKTPLTSIKGFTETLLNSASKSEEQTKKFLKIMEHDATRLSRLIEDLLELSKIESKQIELRKQPLNIHKEIETTIELCKGLPNELGIELKNVGPENHELNVIADRDKLQQILVNLVSNAIKFNKKGGKVFIRVDEAGSLVRITVEDTGVGIAAADVKRIFERFFRVDKARSRELGGTGLGLSIVKHLVETHGGEVWCESVLGKGSKIFFTLPRAEVKV